MLGMHGHRVSEPGASGTERSQGRGWKWQINQVHKSATEPKGFILFWFFFSPQTVEEKQGHQPPLNPAVWEMRTTVDWGCPDRSSLRREPGLPVTSSLSCLLPWYYFTKTRSQGCSSYLLPTLCLELWDGELLLEDIVTEYENIEIPEHWSWDRIWAPSKWWLVIFKLGFMQRMKLAPWKNKKYFLRLYV